MVISFEFPNELVIIVRVLPLVVEVVLEHPDTLSITVTSILTGFDRDGTKLKSKELVVTAAGGAGKSLIKKL